MTTFYFIRHGAIFQAPDLYDPPLSLLGWRQALVTATYLKARPIKYIYSSPLQRAKETALHLAAALRLDIIDDARLRERMNWGDLPGQSFAEFVALWEQCNRNRSYIPPVGDSAQQAGERLECFIQEVQQQYPQDEVVAVTHGGVIADFLLNVFSAEDLGRVNPAFPEQPYSGTVMGHCSLTVIHAQDGTYDLEKIALIEHLNGTF